MPKETRVISQEERFMQEKKINDRVLSFLLSNATQDWEQQKLWIRKSDCSAPTIAKALNVNERKEIITEYTIRNSIKCLLAIGVLSTEKRKINSRERPVYVIQQKNYQYYTIVDMSIIRLSMSLGSPNLLKVYSLIKNRYESYQRTKNPQLLELSLESLNKAVGHTSYVESRAAMKDILDVLCRCSLISLHKETRKSHSNLYEVYIIADVADKYVRTI